MINNYNEWVGLLGYSAAAQRAIINCHVTFSRLLSLILLATIKMSAAVNVLVREAGLLVSPSPGVQVASSVSRVLSNVRAAVAARKVSSRDTERHNLCIPCRYYKLCSCWCFFVAQLALIMNDADQLAGWGELV